MTDGRERFNVDAGALARASCVLLSQITSLESKNEKRGRGAASMLSERQEKYFSAPIFFGPLDALIVSNHKSSSMASPQEN
jgi:hypothetical protein